MILIDVYFSQVKNKPYSREFILEFSTIANKNYSQKKRWERNVKNVAFVWCKLIRRVGNFLSPDKNNRSSHSLPPPPAPPPSCVLPPPCPLPAPSPPSPPHGPQKGMRDSSSFRNSPWRRFFCGLFCNLLIFFAQPSDQALEICTLPECEIWLSRSWILPAPSSSPFLISTSASLQWPSVILPWNFDPQSLALPNFYYIDFHRQCYLITSINSSRSYVSLDCGALETNDFLGSNLN